MFGSTSPFTPRARRSLLRYSQAEVLVDTPPFSKLLTSVLGSPFLTTSDLPSAPDFDLDVVDSPFAAVTGSLSVTRPPSVSSSYPMTPTPAVSCSFFSSTSRKSTFLNSPKSPKGFFPRIWDVLSSSNKKSKGKGKYTLPYDGLPLDGEEGELIDDEACYIEVTAVTGTGTYF